MLFGLVAEVADLQLVAEAADLQPLSITKIFKIKRRSICSLFTNNTVSPFVILQFEIV